MHCYEIPHLNNIVGVANAGHGAFGERCQHVLEGVVFTCVDGYERELSDESIPCLIQMQLVRALECAMCSDDHYNHSHT